MDDFDGNYTEAFGNGTNFGRSPFGGDGLSARMAGREKKAPTVMKFVDCQAIQMGMKRLAFLMDCCHPGNIPDPPFIAATLQLVSALQRTSISVFSQRTLGNFHRSFNRSRTFHRSSTFF